MTSHLDSHITTDVKPDMLSGVQTGNGIPHEIYNIRGIAHVCPSRKDNIFMQRRLVQSFTYILEWGQGTCTLTKHTQRWTYSALLYFFAPVFLLKKKAGKGLGTLYTVIMFHPSDCDGKIGTNMFCKLLYKLTPQGSCTFLQ